MPRGGKREGAGRKPGAGRYNENRALARATVTKVLTADNNPLLVLVDMAWDASLPAQLRKECALAAAGFIQPRLSAVVTASVQAPATIDQTELATKFLERIARVEAARAPTIDAEAEAA